MPLIGGVAHVSGRKIPGEQINDIGQYGEKVHQRTIEMLEGFRQKRVLVLLCTGLGEYSIEIAKRIPHDYLISEYGGVITASNGEPETGYADLIRKEVEAVESYRRLISSHSPRLPIVEEARAASFRIMPDSQHGLSFFTIADILQQIAVPRNDEAIKRLPVISEEHHNTEVTYEIPVVMGSDIRLYRPQTGENGFFVILPENISYKTAADYLAKKSGIQPSNIAAFGNDPFWLDLIGSAGFKYTLAIHGEELRKLVTGMGSFVAEQTSHHGTISILERFALIALPQMIA